MKARQKTLLERTLENDRKTVLACLALVIASAWAFLLAGAGMGMSGLEMTRHSLMGMDMMAPAHWSLDYAVLMFLMWWVMMVAMMLPSASPVILLAAAINRRSTSASGPFGATGAFSMGYLAAWGGFSVAAVALQWGLERLGLINGMMQSSAAMFSAAILILAGAWQFTPWKRACLRHCRNPASVLTDRLERGNAGAFLTGVHHGAYCLGCCWFLMLLLFVGGVMNLVWVAGVALYVAVEKFAPGADLVARTVGLGLIVWGLLVLV